jgi:hypothetical protein
MSNRSRAHLRGLVPMLTLVLRCGLEQTRRAKKWFWESCKPNFVYALASGENHLSQQPYPGPGWLPNREASRFEVPYLALHPMGFSVPRRLRFARWALTPPFHPYPAVAGWAVSSLWHFPSSGLPTVLPRVSPAKPELRGIAPCGVRTFLPRLAPEAILRPPKTASK